MKRIGLAVLVIVLAVGGFFGWQVWSSSQPGAAAPTGATGAITEKIKGIAAKVTAPDEEEPVRCKVGKDLQLVRRWECAARGGIVAADAAGEYTKLTKDEMEARFGKPAVPQASPEEAAAAAESAPGH
jgi:hypothetical protein